MASAEAGASKAFQCGVCKASYSRSDHLIRHMRAHTKQRPFPCALCSKAFSRQDLLKRHAQNHRSIRRPSDPPSSADAPEDLGKHGPRVQQACRSCASKKLRCSDEKPCQRCTSKNILCDYEQTLPSPPDTTIRVAQDRSSVGQPVASLRGVSAPPQTPDVFSLQDTTGDALPSEEAAFPSHSGVTQPSEHADTIHGTRPRQAEGDLSAAQAAYDLLDPTRHAAPPDIWGFTSDLPNFGDYIQMDGFADMGDPNLLFLQDMDMFPAVSGTQESAMLDESPGMGLGTDAYRDSDVHKGWNPGPGATASQSTTLEMPSIAQSDVLTASAGQSPLAIKGDLTMETRDKILAMLFGVTPRSAWNQLSVTFASMEVLKNVVQYALFHMQEHQTIPFIHIASFDINAQRPELLGSLIAYGAVCGRTSSIRASGYCLQESVRMAVQRRLEDEHVAVRDFGIAKAFYILLYLGFWSGMSAKIEAAESNASLGATILRRGKFLQADSYLPVQRPPSEEAQSIVHAWSEWAEVDSRKRLVYFAMLLDAEVSLARNINPLFSYSEIQAPLPASNHLWKATTAQQWHTILTRNTALRESATPIHIILRQPALLKYQLKVADETVVSAAAMAGYWALVREYRQMDSLLAEARDSNNFVQRSRYTELHSLLDHLKMELDEVEALPTQVMLLHELLLLHLNASYYDISAYSGRGTMQEAAAAKAYVQRWFHSESSRHALFSAGQIIRLTRNLKPGHLTDISVIALYHATETMWVWGLIQCAQSPAATPHSLPLIALDVEDSIAVSKFLRTSRGLPGLTGFGEHFVPLNEPAAISDLAHEILEANLGNRIYPLTTREVSRILQGFSRIGRSNLWM